MANQRTLSEKVQDVRTTFTQFQEWLTPPEQRDLLATLTGPEMQVKAAESGDFTAYTELVNASLSLSRIVAANNRAALIAAVLTTASGVARPILDAVGDEFG